MSQNKNTRTKCEKKIKVQEPQNKFCLFFGASTTVMFPTNEKTCHITKIVFGYYGFKTLN